MYQQMLSRSIKFKIPRLSLISGQLVVPVVEHNDLRTDSWGYKISLTWAKHQPSIWSNYSTTERFLHLLPILDGPHHIPLTNSTTIDNAADPLDNAFLNITVLTSDSNVVFSALIIYSGRKREQMCSYNGYCYALDKSRPDGHRYWDCKDRRQ